MAWRIAILLTIALFSYFRSESAFPLGFCDVRLARTYAASAFNRTSLFVGHSAAAYGLQIYDKVLFLLFSTGRRFVIFLQATRLIGLAASTGL